VGAEAFVHLLSDYHARAVGTKERRDHSQRSTARRWSSRRLPSNAAGLVTTSNPEQMRHASHFLCYLNALTHTSGEVTAAFHAELEYALRQNMHILLVHETRTEADGATFKAIIDATPEPLKWDSEKRAKRLYKELAIMICGSKQGAAQAHLNVGLHLLLNATASSGPQHPAQSTSSIADQLVALHELVRSDAWITEPTFTKAPMRQPVLLSAPPPTERDEMALLHEQIVAGLKGEKAGLEEEKVQQQQEITRQQEVIAALQAELDVALTSISEHMPAQTRTMEPLLVEMQTTLEPVSEEAPALELEAHPRAVAPKPQLSLPLRPSHVTKAQAPMDTLRSLGASLANMLVKRQLQTNRGSGSEASGSIRI